MIVELTKEVRERMIICLARAKRREIGGILMAEQLEPGKFCIVDFSIDDFTGSSAHFVRTADHHRVALDAFFARTGNEYARYNYLGEWHSHPNHAPFPSTTDIVSMQDLLNEERSIPFAILLIVKRGWWRRFLCSAVMFSQNQKPSDIQVIMRS